MVSPVLVLVPVQELVVTAPEEVVWERELVETAPAAVVWELVVVAAVAVALESDRSVPRKAQQV
jgi:hypothetical protein